MTILYLYGSISAYPPQTVTRFLPTMVSWCISPQRRMACNTSLRLSLYSVASYSTIWGVVLYTVRFTSLKPYRIRISGRTKHFLNAFGEEVVIENAEAAIAAACRATSTTVRDFTAAPIYFAGAADGSRGGHQWLIEFTQPPHDAAHFTTVLDQTLRQLNSDYDAKRHRDMALAPPTLTVAAPGLFERWLARRGKLGGQHKVPRLSNSRDLLDDILSTT